MAYNALRRFPAKFLDLREVVLTCLIVTYSFVVVSVVVYAGYFSLSYSASFSFVVADGWCDPATQGLGEHCFGDFADFDGRDFRAPWSWFAAPFAHPPLIHLWQAAVFGIGQITGNARLALGMWLIFLAVALLLPAWWGGRGQRPSERALAFLLVGLGSTPFVVSMDRGNSAAFLVPPVLLLAWSVVRDRPWWGVIAIVVAVSVRPQAILLVLIFLAYRRFRYSYRAVLLSLTAILVGFAVYPGNRWANFTQWMENLTLHGGYSNPFNSQVPNFSMARTLALTWQYTKSFAVSPGITNDSISAPERSLEMWILFLTLTMAVVVPTLLWWRGRRLSPLGVLTIPLILMLVLPSTTFAYYAAVMLVPAAMVLAGGARGGSNYLVKCDSPLLTDAVHGAFVLALCVTLVPVALPFSWLLPEFALPSSGLFPQLVGPSWMIVLSLMLLALCWPERLLDPASDPENPLKALSTNE